MSSHHIVREKQEPALYIHHLGTFDEEYLGQLLEWSPTVITTPLVAEQINAYEIKIDAIIADEVAEELQSDVKQIPQNGAAQTEAALKYLIQNDYKAVNVITAVIDLAAFTPFAHQINIVIYSGNQKIYAVNSGFSKWKPAGENFRILSVPLSLQTSGLQTEGGNKFVTTTDGFITLKFDNGFLFISEDI